MYANLLHVMISRITGDQAEKITYSRSTPSLTADYILSCLFYNISLLTTPVGWTGFIEWNVCMTGITKKTYADSVRCARALDFVCPRCQPASESTAINDSLGPPAAKSTRTDTPLTSSSTTATTLAGWRRANGTISGTTAVDRSARVLSSSTTSIWRSSTKSPDSIARRSWATTSASGYPCQLSQRMSTS